MSTKTQRIEVEYLGESQYLVRVVDERSETAHQVSLDPADHKKLVGKGAAVGAEELIRKSFEYLLERESKELILNRFDLTVISRYYPDYEREIKKRVS